MSWQVGDLAVCVDDSPCRVPNRTVSLSLHRGKTYRISAVFLRGYWVHLLVNDESPHVGLAGDQNGWNPDRFRKVVSDKHEACEEEFVTLLNRTKRTVKA